jgi:phosphate transport system protein
MIKKSLEAFINRNAEEAKSICNLDDEIDALYEKVYHKFLTQMIENSETIDRATHLIWIAHNLERIADRATNICERTVYLVTGTMQEVNVSKY